MKVTLDITTHRRADGETETVSFQTDGLFFPDSGGGRIVYRAPTEGMADVTTAITVCGQTVTLENRGGIVSRLILEPGQPHRCRYAAGGGTLTVDVAADRVQNRLFAAVPALFAAYTLRLGGAVSRHELHITLCPAGASPG